jgi:hypothetical protein
MNPHSGRFTATARVALVLLPLILALSSVRAHGAANTLLFPTSIRAAGMGGASNALWWGEDPDDWGNPALVAYHSGLRYSFGRTRLLPQLTDDIHFTSQRITLAGGGLGFASSGRPLDGLGGQRLSYGRSWLEDDTGAPLGQFEAHEDADSWGAGASLAGVTTFLAHRLGSEPPRALRVVDVGLGYARRHVEERYIPTLGEGTTDVSNYGALLRLTPLDTFDSDGGERPVRLDVSYGWSVLNSDDARTDFPFAGTYPAPKMTRHGVAARYAVGGAPEHVPVSTAWYSGVFEPMVSIGVAADFERVEHDGTSSPYDIQRFGLESVVMNVLWLRLGEIEDDAGDIHGLAGGLGVGYQLGDVGSIRYDFASVPQADGRKNLNRHGVTLAVHPFALARSGR